MEKLSEKQKEAIAVLRKYPNDMVMFNYWMTGGHGIRLDARTVESLKKRGIISGGKLSELGKNITI
jgi:hypothetical protein